MKIIAIGALVVAFIWLGIYWLRLLDRWVAEIDPNNDEQLYKMYEADRENPVRRIR